MKTAVEFTATELTDAVRACDAHRDALQAQIKKHNKDSEIKKLGLKEWDAKMNGLEAMLYRNDELRDKLYLKLLAFSKEISETA